jgi:hypothetical protein
MIFEIITDVTKMFSIKIQNNNKLFISTIICILLAVLAIINPASAVPLDSLNNSCVECHKTLSPFSDEQNRFNEIRLNHTERNISCSLECHEDVIRRRATDNFQQWSDSGHSKYYVTCDACHGGDPGAKTASEAHSSMKNKEDLNSSINFRNIPETCGKCHVEELAHFKNTMHFQRLRTEERAPSCTTCHKPHTFKVLKGAEIVPVCSVCHNPKDQIASVGVPKQAKEALDKQMEFQEEYIKAKNAVAQAKSAGKDVYSASQDIEKATSVMNNIPSLWHGFDINTFDEQIQNGIDWTKKAEYKVSGAEPTVPSKTPAVGAVTVLGILVIVYLMRKR